MKYTIPSTYVIYILHFSALEEVWKRRECFPKNRKKAFFEHNSLLRLPISKVLSKSEKWLKEKWPFIHFECDMPAIDIGIGSDDT